MEILSTEQIYQIEQATLQEGDLGCVLMENAGFSVTQQINHYYKPCRVLVICGPGNNGGDGFVIARLLQEGGWQEVAVMLYGEMDRLKGEAKIAATKYGGDIIPFDYNIVREFDLIIDAIFGVGLNRDIDDVLCDAIDVINRYGKDVVAVDIPTGVNGDTGQIMGAAIKASLTVTFSRKKLGHVLMPGKGRVGEIVVADIGISEGFIQQLDVNIWDNNLSLWGDKFPLPTSEQHKYDRGHVVVVGGPIKSTGAACLASVSALRIGAGLVSVACPESALMVYATKLTSVMTKSIVTAQDYTDFIGDKRKNVILIGPGTGVNDMTKERVLQSLEFKKNCVLDADALTIFQDDPQLLFDSIDSQVVLTPHEGEFARIFKIEGGRLEKARQAAKISGAIVVLKGADTVIAHPGGEVVINDVAPPWLATAGSGDVLAGIIAGLMANNMSPFDAACAGVWVHSQAANLAGIGMISESLPDFIPQVLAEIC